VTQVERLVLIGDPVSHSLSPTMHNAALAAAGSSLRYEAVQVDAHDLDRTMATFRAAHVAGNVTSPHKKNVLASMQKLTRVATRVGAVNTFWVDADGDLAGDNTDVTGFFGMVEEVLGHEPVGAHVAVLGAGGAASAVLAALESWEGVTATVHARDLSRASALQMRFSVVVRACSMRDPCLADATIVVNATPVGAGGTDELPVDLDRISPQAAVLDLAYARNETALVRAARDRGHVSSDGLPMLLHQGVAAFHRWLGIDPDIDAMRNALLQAAGRS
jgi:shikimate dehydrogenase